MASVLVPPLGGKVVRSNKRGMLSGKWTMLDYRKMRSPSGAGQRPGGDVTVDGGGYKFEMANLRTLRNLFNLSVAATKNTPYPPARLRPPAPSWGRGSPASGK